MTPKVPKDWRERMQRKLTEENDDVFGVFSGVTRTVSDRGVTVLKAERGYAASSRRTGMDLRSPTGGGSRGNRTI